jgi:Fur family transcriptional regulator, ferric uptake regulator
MSLDDIIVRLRQAGHKITSQRVAIIKIVIESDELLTPSALYKRARELDPEVGEVTVYRTLDILSQLGLVCMVHTSENTHSYIGRPAEHHFHLICSECGRVINFTGCSVSELEKKLVLETGFTIHEHRLDFYGKCLECHEKATGKH